MCLEDKIGDIEVKIKELEELFKGNNYVLTRLKAIKVGVLELNVTYAQDRIEDTKVLKEEINNLLNGPISNIIHRLKDLTRCVSNPYTEPFDLMNPKRVVMMGCPEWVQKKYIEYKNNCPNKMQSYCREQWRPVMSDHTICPLNIYRIVEE